VNNEPKKGLFITLEGIEGAGKSTIAAFMRDWLTRQNIVYISTREPGGTPIAEAIRHVLLEHHTEKMCADTELLLMFASRAQHLGELIVPALDRGEWVISDRFTDASYAYQGGGRGVDIERIAQIENWVQKDLRPDRVILLDLPVELAMSRIRQREHNDRIEQEKFSFFERVRKVYLKRASVYPERYVVIDATLTIDQVQLKVAETLASLADIFVEKESTQDNSTT